MKLICGPSTSLTSSSSSLQHDAMSWTSLSGRCLAAVVAVWLVGCKDYTCEDTASCPGVSSAPPEAGLDSTVISETENLNPGTVPPPSVVTTGAQTGMQTGVQTGMQTSVQTGMQTGVQTGTQTGAQTGMQSDVQTSTDSVVTNPASTGSESASDSSNPSSSTGVAACDQCESGQTECRDGQLTTCALESGCWLWGAPQACPQASCKDGVSCVDPGCPEGSHLCGSACVDDSDPATCGGACSPCPSPSGGGSDCDGTQCLPTCPGGMKICEGACVSQATFCEGEEKANGASCAQDFECLSLNCEDGVCCNTACDGQCEACNLSGSAGTCSPSTTARANNPCAGDGSSCSGSCDGTEAHRDACVYPTSGTLCGASASCSAATNQARTAERCSGTGLCNDATVTNCSPYECNGNVCGTSCPSGEGVCGGACVNIQTDPNHCGGGCTTCGSSTPKCVGGACRECTTSGDCSWVGSVCDSNNTCRCRQPSTNNRLLNPGFDSSSTNWDTPLCASVQLAKHNASQDADLCPRSGAIELTYYGFCFGNLSQCTTVNPNTSYRYGFDYRLAVSGADQVRCAVEEYAGSSCSGNSTTSNDVTNSGSTADTWTHQTAMFLTSATTGSVRVYCQVSNLNTIWIDQIYLNATTNNQYF